MNTKLSVAITAVLGGMACAPALAATEDAGTGALEEITVTAQRRNESIQDVPISIQAFTAQSLQELNIQTFEDYIKYLPNVTSANNGPGQNEVFMRGLSAGSQASQGSSATGLFPQRRDLSRQPVGPAAEPQPRYLCRRSEPHRGARRAPRHTVRVRRRSRVIRYITNEPKLDVTEGDVKAGYGTTAHGDNNSDVTAVLNLPLIDGHMAVRAVIYDDQRGGYINNVPAPSPAATPTSAFPTPAIQP